MELNDFIASPKEAGRWLEEIQAFADRVGAELLGRYGQDAALALMVPVKIFVGHAVAGMTVANVLVEERIATDAELGRAWAYLHQAESVLAAYERGYERADDEA